jgi:hypothetical protein
VGKFQFERQIYACFTETAPSTSARKPRRGHQNCFERAYYCRSRNNKTCVEQKRWRHSDDELMRARERWRVTVPINGSLHHRYGARRSPGLAWSPLCSACLFLPCASVSVSLAHQTRRAGRDQGTQMNAEHIVSIWDCRSLLRSALPPAPVLALRCRLLQFLLEPQSHRGCLLSPAHRRVTGPARRSCQVCCTRTAFRFVCVVRLLLIGIIMVCLSVCMGGGSRSTRSSLFQVLAQMGRTRT